jgi:hypothetical protein
MKNPVRLRCSWRAGLASVPLLWLCTAAQAQWVDPTQPPPAGPGTGTFGARNALAEPTTTAGPNTATGLSVLIVGAHRQLAVINGQILTGPEAEADGVRYRLSVRGVEREQGDGHDTLSLHPKVQKIHRDTAPAAGARTQ